jgi:ribosome maturation factor RimP
MVFSDAYEVFRRRPAILLLVLAVFCLLAPTVMAQQVAVAEIDGYVTDPTGHAIVGGQVKAINVDNRQVHTASTDVTGRYALPNLPIGNYQLEVSSPGFKTYVQKGIELEVASNRSIPVTLQIGAVTDSIQVTANAAQVETKENSVAQVVDQQRLIDLPLNGRNPADLLKITGFSTSVMNLNGNDLTGSKNIQGSNGSGSYSIAGSAANGVNFLLDGGDNNDSFSNVNLPIPFPDAVAEFNVQSNGLPAQYGLHPGGVVNIVTKSGGNALHGDIFDFLRNYELNARPKGTILGQSLRDSLKRNQFGGTAGGRIIKDKLFFFAGYQGTRQRSNPNNSTAYTPTAAVLKGDFSVVDAPKSAGGCVSAQRNLKDVNGNPYPNNQIPVSTFDPAGFKLASTYIPTSPNPCGNILYGVPQNNPDDQWVGRIDYNISSKHMFFGRYYLYDYMAPAFFDGKNALTTATVGNWDRSQTMTVGETYTVSATSVNSFHATFDRRRDNRAGAQNLFSPADLGVNMFLNTKNFSDINVSSYSGGGFSVGCGSCALADFDVNTYQLADDYSIIRGKHQIGFGFDGRKDQFNSYNNQQSNGMFYFNGQTSGDGMADLLIGRLSTLTDGNVISDYIRETVMAAYAQDAIHVSQHFTVNIGVRWEPFQPPYDKYGRGNQFNLNLFAQNWHSPAYPNTPAGLVFSTDSAQDPYGKAFTASDWATFSPRLGLVWDPKGDGKQTLRASFNYNHDTLMLFYPERWTTNSPYVSSITLTTGQFSNPFATYVSPATGKVGDPFPGTALFPVGGTYITIPPKLPVTGVMMWNLSYQRQLGANWVAKVNYMGNAGRHILGSIDINQPELNALGPGGAPASVANENQRRPTYLANAAIGQYYAEMQQSDTGANSEYHGLFLSIERHFAGHYTILTNYAWSHCTSSWDMSAEIASYLYQNSLNRAQGERGNCGYDHRHMFNTTLVATSPGVGGGAAKLLTKDWQVSPILNVLTGNPIQLQDGKDVSMTGTALDRPEVVLPGQTYAVTPNDPHYWFNPLAFQCAFSNAACTILSGQFGNLGRNAVYGPGQINFDMALTRRFTFTERWKLDFRADFFNIMNHANASNPTGTVTSSTFGEITGFSTPRQIQMSVKVFF